MQYCYLNGLIIPFSQAAISPYDRGFLLADGLFETIRCHQGYPIALAEHWQRLSAGAQFLAIPIPANLEQITQSIKKLLITNELEQGASSIRITLTRGQGSRGLLPPAEVKPTLLITAHPLSIDETTTVTLMHSSSRCNEFSPLTAFKTLAYTEKIVARLEAVRKNFDDAVLCNTADDLCSTTSANLFLIQKNEIFTPDLTAGVLPGITRAMILKIAKDQHIKVNCGKLKAAAMAEAEAVFITNSLIGIQVVKQYETTFYRSPFPHPLITLLQQSLQKIFTET